MNRGRAAAVGSSSSDAVTEVEHTIGQLRAVAPLVGFPLDGPPRSVWSPAPDASPVTSSRRPTTWSMMRGVGRRSY
jgi:hypothetical protein